MPMMSSLLNTYPHLLALSASSPVWAGLDTGYASNRALMFQQLPTAGLPFQFDTWEEFEAFAADQLTTGVIEEIVRHPLGHPARAAPRHDREPRLRRRVRPERAARPWPRSIALPRRRPRRPARPPARSCRRCRRGTSRRTSGGPPATGWTPSIILDEQSNERLVTDDLADLLEQLTPVAERLGCEDELRAGRGHPAQGRVVPAAARRGRRAPAATSSPWSTRWSPSSARHSDRQRARRRDLRRSTPADPSRSPSAGR